MPYAITLLLLSYGAAVAGVPGNLPIQFEPNAGQAAPDVKFVGRGGGATVVFTQDGWTLALPDASIQAKVVGANQAPWIEALERHSSTSNHIEGRSFALPLSIGDRRRRIRKCVSRGIRVIEYVSDHAGNTAAGAEQLAVPPPGQSFGVHSLSER